MALIGNTIDTLFSCSYAVFIAINVQVDIIAQHIEVAIINTILKIRVNSLPKNSVISLPKERIGNRNVYRLILNINKLKLRLRPSLNSRVLQLVAVVRATHYQLECLFHLYHTSYLQQHISYT